MSDIAITAANVQAGADAVTETHLAGVAVTAGQAIYLDPTTKHWLLADSNAAAAAAHATKAIALNGAAIGQPLQGQTGGSLTIGGTLTAGVAYYQSATAGALCPVADVTTGDSPTIVGIATSASVLKLAFEASGVTL